MPQYTDAFIARFWAKVTLAGDDDCWLWTGAVAGTATPTGSRPGYGVIGAPHNKPHLLMAHRVSYELSNGPIPPGMHVDHICHQSLCVNPRHLRPATRSQNGQNRLGPDARTTSGARGVSWDRRSKKWVAYAMLDGVQHGGGYFSDIADAERAALALRLRLFTHNDLDRGADGEAVPAVGPAGQVGGW